MYTNEGEELEAWSVVVVQIKTWARHTTKELKERLSPQLYHPQTKVQNAKDTKVRWTGLTRDETAHSMYLIPSLIMDWPHAVMLHAPFVSASPRSPFPGAVPVLTRPLSIAYHQLTASPPSGPVPSHGVHFWCPWPTLLDGDSLASSARIVWTVSAPESPWDWTSDRQPWFSWDCLVLAMRGLGNSSSTDGLEWVTAAEWTSFLLAPSPADVSFSYFSSEDPSTNTCPKSYPSLCIWKTQLGIPTSACEVTSRSSTGSRWY